MTTKQATNLLQALGLDIEPMHMGKIDNHGRNHFKMAMKSVNYDLDFDGLRVWHPDEWYRGEETTDRIFDTVNDTALFANFLTAWAIGLNERAREMSEFMLKLKKEMKDG